MPISEVSKFSILPYTQNRKRENLGKFSFTSILGSIWNSKSKNWTWINDLKEKPLTISCGLRRKMPVSEVSDFSILPYTQNRKLRNLGKFSYNSVLGSIWNSKSKSWKNDLKEKTLTIWCGLRRKMPISEVSKFSILPYTQNRKLGNLRKFSFTSIFGSIWNSKSKNWKNDLKEKTLTIWCGLRRKMPVSEVIKFSILPYTQNWKLGKFGIFSLTSNFYCFGCIKYGKG